MPVPISGERASGADNQVLEFEPGEVNGSIPARFEKVARKFSELPAVRSGRYAWSYSRLNQEANWLAHAILAERGSTPEPVALLFEHEAPLIASMFGVMKANKFFSVLDPSLPSGKLGAILENLQPALMVSNGANLGLAQKLAQPGCRVLDFDSARENYSSENPVQQTTGEMTYSIFYTSGSSGQPKGVQRTHRLELHRVWADLSSCQIRPIDRFSILTTPAFLASMIDITRALLTGATLCMFDVKRYGILNLARWIEREGITFLRLPPTLFRHFVGSLSQSKCLPAIRLVSLSGDVLYRRDIEQARPHFRTDCIFMHSYASSEASLIARLMIHRDTQLSDPIVPAGFPTEDKEVWVLDEDGKQLGSGEVGEIAIRSQEVATGYWRQSGPGLANFIQDRHDQLKRIYLTGDLGRLRPDGMLQFLGRKDSMVKVRGYRVELAVVEAALIELDLFQDVVVTTQPDAIGENRLVAYLKAKIQAPLSVDTVRSLVYPTLPDYMIPSAFVFLETIPLTPTGKPDRQALPRPGQERPALSRPYAPARDALEGTMTAIWEQVLGIEPVGVEDNFLDLGGNSLLAIRIIARLQQALQVELPLRKLFELPTISALAAFISELPEQQETDVELAKLLREVQGLSDQEVEQRLAQYQKQKEDQAGTITPDKTV
jgi:amino acid adenylation domain-containing protein